jgi:hypothetical protein
MADIFLFIKSSWSNIWKQKIIWLFSTLSLFNLVFFSFRNKKVENLPEAVFSLSLVFISIILSIINWIGVPYLAYCLSIEKWLDVQETLFAIKKFSGRVIGCSCLGFILIFPFIIWILSAYINKSTHTFEVPNSTIILLQLLSLLSGLLDFSLFGIFANDWGVWQSAKNAWSLYISHFGILAILGISLAIILKIYSATSGILTVLIQSGFDIASLNQLNIINPDATLSRNLLFALINGIGQVIILPFSRSIFAFAYLKYSGVKAH